MGTEQQQNSNEPSRQQWINNRLNRWVLHDACTEKKNKKMWWNDGSMYRLYACARKKYVSLCTWNLPIPSYLPILNWTRWKINTECRREKKRKEFARPFQWWRAGIKTCRRTPRNYLPYLKTSTCFPLTLLHWCKKTTTKRALRKRSKENRSERKIQRM